MAAVRGMACTCLLISVVGDHQVVVVIERQIDGLETLGEVREAELSLGIAVDVKDTDTAVTGVGDVDEPGSVRHRYAPRFP